MKFTVYAALSTLAWFALACSHKPESASTAALTAGQWAADSQELVINAPVPLPFIIRKPPLNIRRPLETKRLRVLTLHSINSYFLYDGEEHGLEYELLQLYAKSADMDIDIVTVESYKQMYDSIARGNFDIAMGTLVINAAMDSITPFSNPLYHSDIILVKSSTKPSLAGKTDRSMNIIHHSPIHFGIHEWDSISQQTKDSLQHIEPSISKETALELVAKNEFHSLLVDRNDYLLMRSFFPQLTEHSTLKRSQPVAFAFNPHSKSLKNHFNAWHAAKHRGGDYQVTLKKYKDHSSFIEEKLKYEIPVIRQGTISKFDSLIRKYAERESFDWKLIAAIIHQESRFRPTIVSPVGAYGLMQLMPSVAKTYKINFHKLSSPDLNIATGTHYFRWIYNHFDKPEYKAEDKIKFSLAAYNAGIGHVIDARALAVKYKLNPYTWNGNVETMLLNKGTRKYYTDPVVKYGHCRGFETRTYVHNIMQYYEHYQNFLPAENL